MRQTKSQTVSYTGIKKFPSDLHSSVTQEYINKVLANFELCQKLGNTQEGPGIDCKRSRAAYKTYNNDCLRELFGSALQRDLWQAFVKVVFSNSDPKSLSDRFEFSCCKQKTHGVACERKWRELRQVIVDYMGSREVRNIV
jgi:hypothetical protein